MKSFLALFCAILALFLLAGCIEQLSFQANSSVSVNAGRINVSVNVTGAPQAPGEISLAPDNALVCIYGEADERFAGNAFGNLTVLGENVALYTVWFDANSVSRNASFSECAVIALLDDSEGKFVERATREKIVSQLKRGAGLMVSGEGGALSAQDASVYGWKAGGLAEFVPVVIEAPGKHAVPLGRTTFSGKFVPVKTDPALQGVDEFLFDSWSVVHSLPAQGAETIAFARSGQGENSPTQPVYPAVVRSRESLSRNAAYYFSFNAFDSPAAFSNAARFLASGYFNYLYLRVG